MRFGLEERDILIVQKILASCPEVEKAIIFGSRAKGNYKRGSDIDLALVGKDLTLSSLSQISEQLYYSPLPYMFDLLIYHKINTPELLEHIDNVGKEFYSK